jgi:hypothetical protein
VDRRSTLRRLLLLGTPLALALLMVVHQLIDQSERPEAFLLLHLVLLPLFALMGVAVWALLEGSVVPPPGRRAQRRSFFWWVTSPWTRYPA